MQSHQAELRRAHACMSAYGTFRPFQLHRRSACLLSFLLNVTLLAFAINFAASALGTLAS